MMITTNINKTTALTVNNPILFAFTEYFLLCSYEDAPLCFPAGN